MLTHAHSNNMLPPILHSSLPTLYSCICRCCLKNKKTASETPELVAMREKSVVAAIAAANKAEPIYEEVGLTDLKVKPSHSVKPPSITTAANRTLMDRCRLQQERASNPYSNQQLKPRKVVEEIYDSP